MSDFNDIVSGSSDYILEHNCARCGKIFIPTPMWIYKDGSRGFCSWTCYNHRNDGRKTRWQPVECLRSDGTVVSTFQSRAKAAEWMGRIDTKKLKDAIINGTEYRGYFWRYKE